MNDNFSSAYIALPCICRVSALQCTVLFDDFKDTICGCKSLSSITDSTLVSTKKRPQDIDESVFLDRELVGEVIDQLVDLVIDLKIRINDLEKEKKELDRKVADLEHNTSAQNVEIAHLKKDLQKFHIWTTPTKLEDLWEWVEEIETRQQHLKTTLFIQPKPGTKTAQRTEHLKTILKLHNGKALFEDLRVELGEGDKLLSKTQLSKLIGQLDRRIFDVQRHPINKNKKILILRQQIGKRD